jgi:hypothetical protein
LQSAAADCLCGGIRYLQICNPQRRIVCVVVFVIYKYAIRRGGLFTWWYSLSTNMQSAAADCLRGGIHYLQICNPYGVVLLTPDFWLLAPYSRLPRSMSQIRCGERPPRRMTPDFWLFPSVIFLFKYKNNISSL